MRFGAARTLAIAVAGICVAGCDPPSPPVRTVIDLAADPVVLQGLVSRCAADPLRARTDVECDNARKATERLAAEDEANRASTRAAEFERQRTLRREREEQARRASEPAPAFDPYSSPVVGERAPADGTAAAPAAPGTSRR